MKELMTEYCIQYTQNKMNCLDKVLICIAVHTIHTADGLYTVEYVNGEFRNFLYETYPKVTSIAFISLPIKVCILDNLLKGPSSTIFRMAGLLYLTMAGCL